MKCRAPATPVLPVAARRARRIGVRDAVVVERRGHAVPVVGRRRPRRGDRLDGAGLPEKRRWAVESAARARRRRWWGDPVEAYVDRAQATSLRGIDVKIGHSPELGRPRRGPRARG